MMRNPFFVRGGSDLYLRVEVFDWTSPDEKTNIRFHITEMQFAIQEGRLIGEHVMAKLDGEFARRWLTLRELNMNYVRNLPPERILNPVFGAQMPDPEHSVVLIDGSHRYMRRYLDGNYTVPYLLFTEEQWKPFAEIKGTWPCN